jgi:hypothetical protein
LSPRISVFSPLVALVNLFIYILKYPTLPTADSDIALMHIAVGHFGRLEFASADQAFPFARDVTSLASVMVRKAREGFCSGDGTSLPLQSLREQTSIEPAPNEVDNVSLPDISSILFDVHALLTCIFYRDRLRMESRSTFTLKIGVQCSLSFLRVRQLNQTITSSVGILGTLSSLRGG